MKEYNYGPNGGNCWQNDKDQADIASISTAADT